MNRKQCLLDRLRALRNNLPSGTRTEQKYVIEFHIILDLLEEESGQDLDALRVPGSEMQRTVKMKNTLTGDVRKSENPECDRSLLVMKIDSVLAILGVQEEGAGLGFHA